MLVINRNLREEIVIGDETIIIKVLQIVGTSVKIGIEAPRNMSVHRREIYKRIRDPEHLHDGCRTKRIISDE